MGFLEGWGRKRYRYENTRQYLRLKASWPIRYRLVSDPGGERLTTTQDVGAGGVSLVVEEEISKGSRLQLELSVTPLDRRVDAEGEVVRQLPIKRSGFEIGVQFVKMDPQDRSALNEMVQQFIPAHRQARELSPWWRTIP